MILVLIMLLIKPSTKQAPPSKVVLNTMTAMEYKTLGDFAAEQEKLQLAEKCYRKALELEPYNKDMYYELGVFFFQHNRYKEAISELTRHLGGEIIKPEAYFYLASAHLQTGNLNKAEEYFKKLVHLEADDPAIYLGLGQIAQARNHVEQAQQYYAKALEHCITILSARKIYLDRRSGQ
jgi:tetratricopeptide (TPR) repeat protein